MFLKRKISLLLCSFLFSGCGPQNRIEPFVAGLEEAAVVPLRLRVARLEVEKAYTSSGAPPYVEHLFPTPPFVMVQQWIKDRLIPQKNLAREGDYAVVTIEDANVRETSLYGETALGFSSYPRDRYEGRVSVKVAIKDVLGHSKGYVRAVAVVSGTLDGRVSLNERYRFWSSLTESLINSLNREMEQNLHHVLGNFVIKEEV